MSKLISADRVQTNPYYLTYTEDFRLAGFIEVTEWLPGLELGHWDIPKWNRFSNIAHKANVDGVQTNLLPVFVNDIMLPNRCFDGDIFTVLDKEITCLSTAQINELNEKLPAIAFFMGNDDWSYALRFSTFKERDDMIAEFGEELAEAFKLIGQN